MEPTVYHIPALLEPSMEGLDIKADGTYVDVTMGGGGHTRAILERLGPTGRLYGLDQDSDAAVNAPADERFTFVHGNFAFVRNYMRYAGVNQVDGLLADLGVSFHHFDDSERGFSFRHDSRLDMRMNRASDRDARTLLATASEAQLADVFYLYGELRQARRLAAAIVRAREQASIDTTGQLVEVVRPLLRRSAESKELAQVFQALRIEVNHEMEALRRLLDGATSLLRPGGRLVIITYHSLEDRMVKNYMRSGNIEGHVEKDFYGRSSAPLQVVNRSVIVPSNDEVQRNPRSRSAKLRIAQRVTNE